MSGMEIAKKISRQSSDNSSGRRQHAEDIGYTD